MVSLSLSFHIFVIASLLGSNGTMHVKAFENIKDYKPKLCLRVTSPAYTWL